MVSSVTYGRSTNVQLRRKTEAITSQTREFRAEALRINERSVQWLAKRAVKELDTAVKSTGRPAAQHGNLANTLMILENGEVHSWDVGGFRFMRREGMSAHAIYWRVIERGTDRFVGRTVPLRFLRGGRYILPEKQARISGGPDVILGPGGASRSKKFYRVIIERPIQPHQYAARSIRGFEAGRVYGQYMAAAVRRTERVLGGRVLNGI